MARVCWKVVAAIKRSWGNRAKYGTDRENIVRLAQAFDLPTQEIMAIVGYTIKENGDGNT